MGHRGYLTRGDKILILVAVTVGAPLAIFGWPFLVVGLAALCAVLIVVLLARTVVELFIKRRRPAAGAGLDLSRLQPKTTRISHFRTHSGAERDSAGSTTRISRRSATLDA